MDGDLEIRDPRSEVGGQKSDADALVDGLTSDLRPATSGLTLADAEREHILSTLRETNWVVAGPKGVAARLGMKRSTLQKKMRKLGIVRPG
jgi:transcriptional regulator of acetoin/glycerol metabolism